MSGRILTIGSLEREHIPNLAARLSAGDRRECLDLGVSPEAALMAGYRGAFSLVVYRGEADYPVGAFGVTGAGIVWSLWADLTPDEMRYLRQEAPHWIEWMAINVHGGPLRNHVSVANRQALLWIHRTGCFDVADTPHQINGRDYLHFQTKAELHLNV